MTLNKTQKTMLRKVSKLHIKTLIRAAKSPKQIPKFRDECSSLEVVEIIQDTIGRYEKLIHNPSYLYGIITKEESITLQQLIMVVYIDTLEEEVVIQLLSKLKLIEFILSNQN